MSSIQIRVARIDDVEELADLHVATWREAYHGQLAPEFFGAEAVASRRALWTRVLSGDAVTDVAVAELAGVLVGLASAGAPLDERDRALGLDRQLYTLYVLAQHHGSGAGQDLFDAVMPPGPALLWVAKLNPRAQSFYRRNGFRFDGVEHRDDRTPTFVEARMVRS